MLPFQSRTVLPVLPFGVSLGKIVAWYLSGSPGWMAGLRHLLALQSIFFRIREQVSEISARAFVAPAQVRFVRRPCESYQGLLQMPKIVRFRRSPVEL